MKKNKITQKLIDFLIVDKKFESINPDFLLTFLKKASLNRVLYETSRKILLEDKRLSDMTKTSESNLRLIVQEGEKYLKRLRETLFFINNQFSEYPFLIVKTFKNHHYITYDVDVLVKPEDFPKIRKHIGKLIEVHSHPGGRVRRQIYLKGQKLLKIDLHQGFFWYGGQYLDQDEVWRNVGKISYEGQEVPIPSREVEVLINLAHLLMERRYITLLDFWYFYEEFMKGIDRNFIFSQAKKYGWDESLRFCLEALETISRTYNLKKNLFSESLIKRKNVDLPLFFNVGEVLKIFLERLQKAKVFSYFEFSYFFFVYGRYCLSGRKRLPYYLEWFDFHTLRKIR